MVRAGSGLFLLMAVVWGMVMFRQGRDIELQRTSQWMEKRRVAESLASRSVSVLLDPSEYSIDQTNLSAELSKLAGRSSEIAWVRLVDATGNIRASSRIDEVFQPAPGDGGRLLVDEGRFVWTSHVADGRPVREVAVTVSVPGGGGALDIGHLRLGVYEDAVDEAIEDTRVQTTLMLLLMFAGGMLLVVGLVQVFVKPIQVLTDGVRAIGDGNLDGKLDVRGPAEIGAIAGVFNEITEKFKKAQTSILEQEKMQKEIEVAKQIQQSLLPRRRPRARRPRGPGRPARSRPAAGATPPPPRRRSSRRGGPPPRARGP
jgi:hypothetical protein